MGLYYENDNLFYSVNYKINQRKRIFEKFQQEIACDEFINFKPERGH